MKIGPTLMRFCTLPRRANTSVFFVPVGNFDPGAITNVTKRLVFLLEL